MPLTRAADTNAQWLNGTGNWNDPTQWSTNPSFPNNGTLSYAVNAPSGTITLNQNITVDQFTLSYNPPSSSPPPNVTLQGSNTLTVNSAFSWDVGTISGSGTLNSLGTTTISGNSNNLGGWTLDLAGTTSLNGQIILSSNAIINNQLGASLSLSDASYVGGSLYNKNSTLNNFGTINSNASTNGVDMSLASLNNSGTININTGTLYLASGINSTGNVNVASGATLYINYNTSGTFSGSSSISGAGNVTLQGGSIGINGNYNVSGTTAFNGTTAIFGSSSTFTGNTVNFQAGTTTINGAYNDSGTTTFSGSSNTTFGASSTLGGTGSVNFSGGTVVINGGYDVSGLTTFQASPTVTFAGPTTFNQAITLAHGSTTFSGSLAATSMVIGGQFSTTTFNSNSTLNSLKLSLGTITGTGTITASSLEWDEVSMTGTGTTVATNGVFFNGLTDTVQFDILDRTLNCYGSSSVQTSNPYSGNLYFGTNAALNIMPGATFNGSFLSIQGSDISGQMWGTMTNQGTLIINNPSINDGLGVYGSNFENKGVIQVTNSTLEVLSTTGQAGFNQDGGTTVLNNGALEGALLC